MVPQFILDALTPKAVGFFLKYIARPALYLACLWLVWCWDADRIGAIRADAAREKEAAIEARDNHWKGEIARRNAELEARRANEAIEAGKVSATLVEQNAAFAARIAEMEKANAALPNPDACGLDRDRVRLLRDGTARPADRPAR